MAKSIFEKENFINFSFPKCNDCRHDRGDGTCNAFPDGIPSEILTGENKHKKPLYGQDNTIVFEEK